MGRTFITGDVHRVYDIKKIKRFSELIGSDLTKDDVLIVAGDFGMYWESYESKGEKELKQWYDEQSFTTLWIDGNHENHDRIEELPTENLFGSEVGRCSESVFHLRRGHVYHINGKTFWVMGGGYSIDKVRRIEGESWWPQELPSRKEMEDGAQALKSVDFSVDYVITHTAPRSVVQRFLQENTYMMLKVNAEPEYDFQDYLQGLLLITEFKRWYFGHFHQDRSLLDEKFRCIYNQVEEVE